ncbi:hypothetical protein RFI_35186 [Reticulomyxa filosa]|uniref:Transmembrane protein n=1 Tax=Reticulomyxa filosa TaxID=46433 RepID=X6LNE5_RETFI|nr:hypothetical protein RFI_35186 [Reticulomyxa filosa]|eukprot:ETO02250.1 hypothetical protein RFI_35186 [Reticulomyxa filosa]
MLLIFLFMSVNYAKYFCLLMSKFLCKEQENGNIIYFFFLFLWKIQFSYYKIIYVLFKNFCTYLFILIRKVFFIIMKSILKNIFSKKKSRFIGRKRKNTKEIDDLFCIVIFFALFLSSLLLYQMEIQLQQKTIYSCRYNNVDKQNYSLFLCYKFSFLNGDLGSCYRFFLSYSSKTRVMYAKDKIQCGVTKRMYTT